MLILKAEQLQKDWDGKEIFRDVNLEINEGEHLALIGDNGVGKTTLFDILLGKTTANKGTIYRKYPVAEWGVLEQSPYFAEKWTVLDFVKQSNHELFKINHDLVVLQAALNKNDSTEIIERYNRIYQRYLDLEGFNWELIIEKQLKEFGFLPNIWDTPFTALSGGQKTLAQLVRLLVNQPKFILLDEPTNHLDQSVLKYLTDWMQGYSGTILFISHDRYFLDQTAQGIYELASTGTTRYLGGYSKYYQSKEQALKAHLAQYEKQEKERKKLQEAIQRFKQWYELSHSAASVRDPIAKKKANKHITRMRAKEQALERLEEQSVEKPKTTKQINFNLTNTAFNAKTLINLQDVEFSYGTKSLFSNLSFSINRGERVAVLGKNGAGKTTLLKLINKELTSSQGKIAHHPALKIGYFAQELNDLKIDETILDTLLGLSSLTQAEVRNILASFHFRKEDVFKKIKDLSMGEKCRVASVKLYFSKANLLVLDEPTNYLDITTREKIEEVLAEYPGAFIVVSHDLYLIKRLATKIIDLEDEHKCFQGSYLEYLDHKSLKQDNKSIDVQNIITQLKLRLITLMNKDIPEVEEEKAALLAEIQRVKAQIGELSNQ